MRVANGSTGPVDKLIAQNYCDICNPFGYANSIMGDPKQRKDHIKDAIRTRSIFSTVICHRSRMSSPTALSTATQRVRSSISWKG